MYSALGPTNQGFPCSHPMHLLIQGAISAVEFYGGFTIFQDKTWQYAPLVLASWTARALIAKLMVNSDITSTIIYSGIASIVSAGYGLGNACREENRAFLNEHDWNVTLPMPCGGMPRGTASWT